MEGIGAIDKIWIGYTADQKVRLNSASGGIVTGSLLALLKSGDIDGAVVNVPDLEYPPHGKSILAKSEGDLMQSSKSIYCMTEINRGLSLVEGDFSVDKVAVVGLPCHISSLRQRMQDNVFLKDKVVVCFGIMCGHNMHAKATVVALEESGISIHDVKKVVYRAHGWYPFDYHVEMKDGSVKKFLWPDSSLQKIWDSLEYQPKACQTCSDFAAEQADIACCDAWLEEYRGDQEGYSLVLTHTPLGSTYIENLIQDGTLLLKRCDESYIQRSQYNQIAQKLENKRRHL